MALPIRGIIGQQFGAGVCRDNRLPMIMAPASVVTLLRGKALRAWWQRRTIVAYSTRSPISLPVLPRSREPGWRSVPAVTRSIPRQSARRRAIWKRALPTGMRYSRPARVEVITLATVAVLLPAADIRHSMAGLVWVVGA